MTPLTPFSETLLKNARAYVRKAKRAGTVGMSLRGLMQTVPTPSPALDGAPRGTNAQFYYAELFREVVLADKAVAAFITSN